MPFFDWKCKHCPLVVNVMRRVADSEVQPEVITEFVESPTHLHEFEKVLGATQTTFRHNDRKAFKGTKRD